MSLFKRLFKSTPDHPTSPSSTGGWQPGDVIFDQYEVREVFTGGMGAVYRVRHHGWDMDLAVKRPRPEYLRTMMDAENFEREAETWANLHLHPNIATCHYIRRQGGIPLIFAEFVEGGSLAEWIDGRKLYAGGPQQSLARILDVATQMARALDFAHTSGLVHQDVKPANVLMTPDGTAKLTDFGLARARKIAGHERSPTTRDSIIVSIGGMTPAYASPEQFAGLALSRRTDVWSWALSVLEMFQGKLTWTTGPSANNTLNSYLATIPEDSSIPAMPTAIVDLLRHCFSYDPDTRPEDMTSIATTLELIYEEELGAHYPRG